MSHRQVLEALSGMLLAMFVAVLSGTVVTTALPQMMSDLDGSQSAYAWVVASTLLAFTISAPIWGKLADLVDRKLLVQSALGIYVAGSLLAGLAQSTGWLISCRVVQGLGIGGVMALVQIVLADLVSPRERGRYTGYIGATFGVATVAGPLLGGLVTDLGGWRWCFYVGVPFSLAAAAVLQRTLRLPHPGRRRVRLDVPGALLLAGGVASLLAWVSLAGRSFAWGSWQTAALVGGGLLLLTVALAVERRAPEPIMPLRLFSNRTIVLAAIASVAVGTTMFGAAMFLSQYMQIARGYTPTASGLLTIPMVVGLFISSLAIGRIVTRTGRYKRWMLLGAVLLTTGLAAMGTLDEHTSLGALCVYMALVGAGVGMLGQNLVLVVQNVVPQRDLGAGSSLITFLRSLGGVVGVSVLGAVLAARASASIDDGLAQLGAGAQPAVSDGQVPDVSALSAPVARVVEHAYGIGIAEVFLLAAPLGVVTLVALILMREHPLGVKSGIELAQERAAERPGEPASASATALQRA